VYFIHLAYTDKVVELLTGFPWVRQISGHYRWR